jgi:amino-acid N-acetyltransferase
MEPPVIRNARSADVQAILGLIELGTESGKILRRTPHDVRKNLRHFFVAEAPVGRDGILEIVACCSLEVYNRKLAEIRSLTVRPDYRRKGMATALVDKCLKEARRRRVYEVLAITDRENLFKRVGFAEQLHGQKALFTRPGHRA